MVSSSNFDDRLKSPFILVFRPGASITGLRISSHIVDHVVFCVSHPPKPAPVTSTTQTPLDATLGQYANRLPMLSQESHFIKARKVVHLDFTTQKQVL